MFPHHMIDNLQGMFFLESGLYNRTLPWQLYVKVDHLYELQLKPILQQEWLEQ